MSSFSKDKTQDGLRASASKNLDATLDYYLKYAATDECDTGGNGYEWVFRHEDLIAMRLRQAARCEPKSQVRLPFRSSMGYNADSHLKAHAVRRLQVPVPPTVTPVSGLPSDTNNDRVEPIDLTHQPLFKKQPIRQPIGPTSYSGFINGQRSTKLSLGVKETLERGIEATGPKGQSSPQVQDHVSGELRRNATLHPPTDHLKTQGTCCEPPSTYPSIAQLATLKAQRGVNAHEMRRAYLAKTQHLSEADRRLLDSSEVAPVNSPSLSRMMRAPASYWVHPNGQYVPVGSHEMPSRTTFTSKTESTTPEDPPLGNCKASAVRDNEPYLSSASKPSDPVPSSPLAAPLKPIPRVSGTSVISGKTRQSAASAAKATRLFLHRDPANAGKPIPAEATISNWLLLGASFEVLCQILETMDLVIDRAGLLVVCPELKTGAIGQAAAETTKPPVSAAHGASSTANRTRVFQPRIPDNAFGPRTGPATTYSNNRYYSAFVPRTGPATTYSNNPQQHHGYTAMNDDREHIDQMKRYLAQLADSATVKNQFKTQDEAKNDDDDFHVVGDPIEDDSEWDLVNHEDAC